jgi:hypothetical protein
LGLDGLKPPAVVGCENIGLHSSEEEVIRDLDIEADIAAEIAAELAKGDLKS